MEEEKFRFLPGDMFGDIYSGEMTISEKLFLFTLGTSHNRPICKEDISCATRRYASLVRKIREKEAFKVGEGIEKLIVLHSDIFIVHMCGYTAKFIQKTKKVTFKKYGIDTEISPEYSFEEATKINADFADFFSSYEKVYSIVTNMPMQEFVNQGGLREIIKIITTEKALRTYLDQQT